MLNSLIMTIPEVLVFNLGSTHHGRAKWWRDLGALIFLVHVPLGFLAVQANGEERRPPGVPPSFVDLTWAVPNVLIDPRYFGENNFVGKPIDGYTAPRCWATSEAATALAKVQAELQPFGLGLKVFDAYRPQSAVNHFVRWVQTTDRSETKSQYYPKVEKTRLIADGFISDRSGHSRGSTIDLTIVSLPKNQNQVPVELDMGSPFDFFGEESRTDFPHLTQAQRQNRLLLKVLMERHGFVNYSKEWWHFRLRDEPYPDTYFDFPTGGVSSPEAASVEGRSQEDSLD